MLTYAFKITMQLLQNRKFRTLVLRTLVRLYLNLQVPDFISVCQVGIPVRVLFAMSTSTIRLVPDLSR